MEKRTSKLQAYIAGTLLTAASLVGCNYQGINYAGPINANEDKIRKSAYTQPTTQSTSRPQAEGSIEKADFFKNGKGFGL